MYEEWSLFTLNLFVDYDWMVLVDILFTKNYTNDFVSNLIQIKSSTVIQNFYFILSKDYSQQILRSGFSFYLYELVIEDLQPVILDFTILVLLILYTLHIMYRIKIIF